MDSEWFSEQGVYGCFTDIPLRVYLARNIYLVGTSPVSDPPVRTLFSMDFTGYFLSYLFVLSVFVWFQQSSLIPQPLP